jgi:hypothetical protein
MALIATALKQNPVLAALTDEQMSIIEAMSKADEDAIVGAKFKNGVTAVDEVLSRLTGKPIAQGKRTIEWVEEEYLALKKQVDELSALKAQVADGKGSEVMKEQLKNLQTQLELKESQLASSSAEQARIKSEYDKATKTLAEKDIRSRFELGVAGKVSKIDANEAKELLQIKVDKFLAGHTREVTTGTDGKQTVVWRNNETSQILLDPSQNNAPLNEEGWLKLNASSLFDFGSKAPGAGSGQSNSTSGGGIAFSDWKGAKTKVEAMKSINDHLFAKGIATSAPNYYEEWDKVVGDEKAAYDALPSGYM